MHSRTSPCDPALALADLPDATLSHLASYLPKPSAALLAVALTAPASLSSSWRSVANGERHPSAASKIVFPPSLIVALDFSDIEKSLAGKLNDDDLRAILVCTNAVKNLNRLKLAGCTNIVGYGLEPLRGSIVLEQMDLSMSGYDSPFSINATKLSQEAVLPILDSIVAEDGNSLKHFQPPLMWNDGRIRAFTRFLLRYKGLLESRSSRCSRCERSCTIPCYGRLWRPRRYNFALQGNTCFYCVKLFCCRSEGKCRVEACSNCFQNYCENCATACGICKKCSRCAMTPTKTCEAGCGKNICGECSHTCLGCDRNGCSICLGFGRLEECANNVNVDCHEGYCRECVIICHVCEKCSGCVSMPMQTCEEADCGKNVCGECIVACESCNRSGCSRCIYFGQCQSDNCDKGHSEECHDGDKYDVENCGSLSCKTTLYSELGITSII